MFGVSFTELLLIGAVTLVIVGPQRLPKMLGTLGRWSAKLRRITNEVRYQSGIDDILRKEGISGGLSELRQLRDVARGNWAGLGASAMASRPKAGASAAKGSSPSASGNAATAIADEDPFAHVENDRSREYPTEGCDAYGALPDDMWSDPANDDQPTTPGADAATTPEAVATTPGADATTAGAVAASEAASVDATSTDPATASPSPISELPANDPAADGVAAPNPNWNDQPAEKS